MKNTKVSPGVVHQVPQDLKQLLLSKVKLIETWESLTPLARNEWLCWIASAKKVTTKNKRMEWMESDLMKGKKRPCCWPGCSHR